MVSSSSTVPRVRGRVRVRVRVRVTVTVTVTVTVPRAHTERAAVEVGRRGASLGLVRVRDGGEG